MTILCEASDGPCEKLRSDIRVNIAEVAKMMVGDPSVKCQVNYENLKCGAEPARKQTDQRIYVQVSDDATCTIDNVATSCQEVAKTIRTEHPLDNPKIAVCVSEKAKYDVVGKLLGTLNEEYLNASVRLPSALLHLCWKANPAEFNRLGLVARAETHGTGRLEVL